MSKQTDLINVTDAITVSGSNVGIGTSSPTAVFDVRRGDADGKIAEFHQSSGYGFELSSSTSVATITSGYNQAFVFETGTTATERMRINSSGNVGIGTSSPAKALDVEGAIRSNITGGTSPAEIDISSGSTWRLRSNATSGTNAYGMDIVKGSAGTDVKLSVDSSGNLLVGKTSLGISNAGHTLAADGYTEFTRTATSTSTGGTINVGRNSYDGPLATFWKDGSTVGTIGTDAGIIYAGGGDAFLGFDSTYNLIKPASTSTGGGSDGLLDLGGTTRRFKDAYQSGGVYLGGTGSANKLEDYEHGTWSPFWCNNTGQAIFTVNPSINMARYIKIGKQVTVSCYFNMPATFSTTGNYFGGGALMIGGLPFTPNGNGGVNDYYAGSVGWYGSWSSSYNSVSNQTPLVYTRTNATQIELGYANGVGHSGTPQETAYNSNSGILFTISYLTNS